MEVVVEVDPASLEAICAVFAVRHAVAPERLARGTAVSHPVADVVDAMHAMDAARQWMGQDYMWETPLWRAATGGSLGGMQFFLAETAPAGRLEDMGQALVGAATSSCVAAVQWLVERGADVHHNRDRALKVSAQMGHLPVVRWLASKGGADVHVEFEDPLRYSAWHGHLPVVQWLVEEGGADVHAFGDGALWMSAERGQLAVVRWLVEEGGANVHAGMGGNAVLLLSARNGHLAVVRYLLSPESGAEWIGPAVRAVLKDDGVQDKAVRAALEAAVDRLEAAE